MNVLIRSSCVAAAVLAMAGMPAQAQSVGIGARVEAGPGARDVRSEDPLAQRLCVRETGSRITPRRDRKGQCTGFGRSYSREELQSTGRIDMADALRVLDPSFR